MQDHCVCYCDGDFDFVYLLFCRYFENFLQTLKEAHMFSF